MNRELKVTKQMIDESRHQGYNVYGMLKGYCDLHNCCEICNKRVRLLCKVKRVIEKIQEKLINKMHS